MDCENFFPKKHFEWKEPKEFRRLVDAQETRRRKWWMQPLAALALALLLLLRFWLARLDPSAHPPSIATAVAVAAFGGWLFAYGLLWVIFKMPSFVTVRDTYIHRARGNVQRRWKLQTDVISYEWLRRTEYMTLVLTLKTGRQVFIGVPNNVPIESLDAFLASKCGKRSEAQSN